MSTEVRDAYWEDSAKWRTDSKNIRINVAVFFKDERIQSTFQELVGKRNLLGNNMMRFLQGTILRKDVDATRTDSLKLLKEIDDLLWQCGKLMAKEIERDQAAA